MSSAAATDSSSLHSGADGFVALPEVPSPVLSGARRFTWPLVAAASMFPSMPGVSLATCDSVSAHASACEAAWCAVHGGRQPDARDLISVCVRSRHGDDPSLRDLAVILADSFGAREIERWIAATDLGGPRTTVRALDMIAATFAERAQYREAEAIERRIAVLDPSPAPDVQCARSLRHAYVEQLGKPTIDEIKVAGGAVGTVCRSPMEDAICDRAVDGARPGGSSAAAYGIILECRGYLARHREDTNEVYLAAAVAAWPATGDSHAWHWTDDAKLAEAAYPRRGALAVEIAALKNALAATCNADTVAEIHRMASAVVGLSATDPDRKQDLEQLEHAACPR